MIMLRMLVVAILFLLAASHGCMAGAVTENYGGRNMIIYVPSRLPDAGSRAMVVVLHGGLGNASRIETGGAEHALNLDAEAEKNGFVVVYLNGTPVTRLLGDDKLGWNAGGGCCGMSAERNVDDVGYITHAVGQLAGEYGIDPHRIYGMGHSNGAMMTQRLMCETGLYAAAIAISGPLNLDVQTCPATQGKAILAIHGANDENVPVAGGRGTKGLSKADYQSERHSQQVYANSGATYQLQIVPDADHMLDHIDEAMRRCGAGSIDDEAVQFFGLSAKN